VRRLALLLVTIAALAAPANAGAATELRARVVSLTIFELTYPDGSPVGHLEPGDYTIVVNDQTGGHTFHLLGPGVDMTSGRTLANQGSGPINAGLTGTQTWNVTLQDGPYQFFCDIHPGAMYGEFTVGNVLTVAIAGTGLGSVTSSPAGISCGASCSIGLPLSSSVTLTATPAGGSEFKGWNGAGCSGTGLCTVFSSPGQWNVIARFDWTNGIPPPPPPVVTPPARITRVTVVRVNGRRVVRVRLAVVRHTAVIARLRRAGKTLAGSSAHVAPGTRTVSVRVPLAAKGGLYGVWVRITDAVSGDTRSVTRQVRIPAP
jgi:hypothetical protein